MKGNIIKFLYALDCYLLYLLSGIIAAAGVVAYYSISAAFDFDAARVGYAAFSEILSDFLSGKSSVVLLVSYILVLVGVLLVFFFRKQNLAAYSGMSYMKAKSIVFSLLLGACLSFVTYNFIPPVAGEEAPVSVMLVFCVILGPFIEELMFRGILLKMFGASVGILFAGIITSALFAVSHTDVTQMLYTFVLGLILCAVRIRSTSLWSAVSLHMAFNICGAFVWQRQISLTAKETVLLILLSGVFFIFACSGGRKKAVRKSARNKA